MAQKSSPRLPASVREFLDGRDLGTKVGKTVLLSACEPGGWPRMALLSVGEVVAMNDTEVRLAVYANSRTTRALRGSRRGLLSLVVAGALYKIGIYAEPIRARMIPATSSPFRCRVVAVDEDHVGYASITEGIQYTVVEGESIIERWREQIEYLQCVDESHDH